MIYVGFKNIILKKLWVFFITPRHYDIYRSINFIPQLNILIEINEVIVLANFMIYDAIVV